MARLIFAMLTLVTVALIQSRPGQTAPFKPPGEDKLENTLRDRCISGGIRASIKGPDERIIFVWLCHDKPTGELIWNYLTKRSKADGSKYEYSYSAGQLACWRFPLSLEDPSGPWVKTCAVVGQATHS
jgi:hypothetical protein